MEIVVQKYGGTSIGKADRIKNVAHIVQQTIAEGQRVVVVLSAMSDTLKKDGTTSKLLDAAKEAISKGSYYRIIDQLEEYHLDIATNSIVDRRICDQLVEDIRKELRELKSFLDAIQVIGEISQRSVDVVISTGEKLSAMIFSSLLNSMGTDADYINLSKIIEKEFKEIDHRFCSYLQNKLGDIAKKSGARVPVVTGFFGFVPNGILKSIGRGYTDFTASLIAVGVQAKELQIWKEVDGIFTADPKKVKTARVLRSISPDEASELTHFGSEVIHPFTMEQVISANIPVRIKNTFNPDSPGTIIDPNRKNQKSGKGGTAVTVKRNVTLMNIQSNRMLMAYGFMSRMFDIFNKHEIVIDMVSTSEVNVSLTVDSSHNLEPVIKELRQLGTVSTRKEMAILSLVGQGMQHTIGIAGKMFAQLSKENINIEMISQGASEINISCAIEDYQSDKALRAVHEMLL